MFNLRASLLVPGILFSLIGFVAFRYGRSLQLWKTLVIGLALMIFPYFFSSVWLLWGVGIALLGALWFYRNE
jgi:hypothetical protein